MLRHLDCKQLDSQWKNRRQICFCVTLGQALSRDCTQDRQQPGMHIAAPQPWVLNEEGLYTVPLFGGLSSLGKFNWKLGWHSPSVVVSIGHEISQKIELAG